MPSSKYFVRKRLHHATPSWIAEGSVIFITLCATDRELRPLLREGVPQQLLASALHYHRIGRWYVRLFLIMPDHVHGLVAVPPAESLRKVVAAWKSYVAKASGVRWQRDFFEHRPRDLAALEEKETYIRNNPVRGKLVNQAGEWPWVLRAVDEKSGS